MKRFLSLLLLLTFLHIQNSIAQKNDVVLNAKQVKMVIDTLGRKLVDYYVFPDIGLKMDQYLKAQYRAGAYNNITSPQKLADKLYADIKTVHIDPHMGVAYNPDFDKQRMPDKNAVQSAKDDSIRLNQLRETNFNFKKVEILPGNIGYLQFNQFVGDIKNAKPIVAAALTFLSNTKALIIDLRTNGGGSPDMVSHIESYFFKQKTHMNDLVDRLGKDTSVFYADPAKTDGITLSMPLYILTSNQTFSGAEDFTYGMQSVKRATVIGDTTGGGAHPVSGFPITNGLFARIPFARSLNPYTHTDWEGTGVIPDIATPWANALAKALETIYNKRLTEATKDEEKKMISWQLNRLQATYHPFKIDTKILEQYVGIYDNGDLKLYIKNGGLYCQNKKRRNYTFELTPISNSIFAWSDNTDLEVEFIKDKNGNYTTMNFLGPGGLLWQDNRVN